MGAAVGPVTVMVLTGSPIAPVPTWFKITSGRLQIKLIPSHVDGAGIKVSAAYVFNVPPGVKPEQLPDISP